MKIQLKNGQQVYVISDTHYDHKNICRGVSAWNPNYVPGDDEPVTAPRSKSEFLKSTRDFRDLYHMNSTIINNINEVVGEDDILIHLGDWSFGGLENIWNFRKQIVCKNIYFINGNHDHHIIDDKVLPNVHEHRDHEGVFVDGPNPNSYGDDRDRIFDVTAIQLFTWVGYYGEFEFVYPHTNKMIAKERITFVASHYPMVSWNKMGSGKIMLHGHVHLPPSRKIHQGKSMDVGVDGNNFKPYNLTEIKKIMDKQPIATTSATDDHHLG